MKLASPVRVEVATSIGLSPRSVLELDRMCIRPDRHKKNFGSWLLARLVSEVRKDFPNISHLVSFADPGYGHDGTIYKAANWKFSGSTSRSYEYVSKSGKRIHKKTVYGLARSRGLREREYAEMEGLARSSTVSKLKFIYDLNRS